MVFHLPLLTVHLSPESFGHGKGHKPEHIIPHQHIGNRLQGKAQAGFRPKAEGILRPCNHIFITAAVIILHQSKAAIGSAEYRQLQNGRIAHRIALRYSHGHNGAGFGKYGHRSQIPIYRQLPAAPVNSAAVVANLACFGIEGGHYDIVDGRIQVRSESGYKYNGVWSVTNVTAPDLLAGEAGDKKEQYAEFNINAAVTSNCGFVFDNWNVEAKVTAIAGVDAEYSTLMRRGLMCLKEFKDLLMGEPVVKVEEKPPPEGDGQS